MYIRVLLKSLVGILISLSLPVLPYLSPYLSSSQDCDFNKMN